MAIVANRLIAWFTNLPSWFLPLAMTSIYILLLLKKDFFLFSVMLACLGGLGFLSSNLRIFGSFPPLPSFPPLLLSLETLLTVKRLVDAVPSLAIDSQDGCGHIVITEDLGKQIGGEIQACSSLSCPESLTLTGTCDEQGMEQTDLFIMSHVTPGHSWSESWLWRPGTYMPAHHTHWLLLSLWIHWAAMSLASPDSIALHLSHRLLFFTIQH